MSFFRKGAWRIETMLLNRETVMNHDSFQSFEVTGDELVINPVGMRFKIEPETMHSAVLRSEGHVYFADWTVSEDQIELVLSRPETKETITIAAEMQPCLASNVA